MNFGKHYFANATLKNSTTSSNLTFITILNNATKAFSRFMCIFSYADFAVLFNNLACLDTSYWMIFFELKIYIILWIKHLQKVILLILFFTWPVFFFCLFVLFSLASSTLDQVLDPWKLNRLHLLWFIYFDLFFLIKLRYMLFIDTRKVYLVNWLRIWGLKCEYFYFRLFP